MPATDRCCVATVLTACGIETSSNWPQIFSRRNKVATVLTACGIETVVCCDSELAICCCNSAYRLRYWNVSFARYVYSLLDRCNSAYRLRYWNLWNECMLHRPLQSRCNSAYRLRYWNFVPRCKIWAHTFKNVATVLTACGIETWQQGRICSCTAS